MHRPSEDHYLTPYREAIARHGAGFDAMLWNDRQAQQLRFDVMIETVDFSDQTVLDAGCGHGDFAARLIDRGVSFRRFIGIDAFGEQIEEARQRKLAHTVFEVGDFVSDTSVFDRHAPDWIVFSGSLNTMDDDMVTRLLERAFNVARKGMVFNFLSDRPHARYRDIDLRPARRFNSVELIDWALVHTPRVVFRQDYLDGHDATIAMWQAALAE